MYAQESICPLLLRSCCCCHWQRQVVPYVTLRSTLESTRSGNPLTLLLLLLLLLLLHCCMLLHIHCCCCCCCCSYGTHVCPGEYLSNTEVELALSGEPEAVRSPGSATVDHPLPSRLPPQVLLLLRLLHYLVFLPSLVTSLRLQLAAPNTLAH
jgi:hypothetical protein